VKHIVDRVPSCGFTETIASWVIKVEFPYVPNSVIQGSEQTVSTISYRRAITLRWLDPAEYGFSDIDGALCVTAYKINGADSDDHQRIKQQTEEEGYDVQLCRDAYNNAPGMVYVPVETAAEIRDGFQMLKTHFWEHGGEYGVNPDAVE
jgi:hypothetical protein